MRAESVCFSGPDSGRGKRAILKLFLDLWELMEDMASEVFGGAPLREFSTSLWQVVQPLGQGPWGYGHGREWC